MGSLTSGKPACYSVISTTRSLRCNKLVFLFQIPICPFGQVEGGQRAGLKWRQLTGHFANRCWKAPVIWVISTKGSLPRSQVLCVHYDELTCRARRNVD